MKQNRLAYTKCLFLCIYIYIKREREREREREKEITILFSLYHNLPSKQYSRFARGTRSRLSHYVFKRLTRKNVLFGVVLMVVVVAGGKFSQEWGWREIPLITWWFLKHNYSVTYLIVFLFLFLPFFYPHSSSHQLFILLIPPFRLLVVFYGISTMAGYLMPNHVCTYVLNKYDL